MTKSLSIMQKAMYTTKLKSRITVTIILLALLISLSSCGTPAPSETTPATAEKTVLVLGVIDSETGLDSIIEAFNESEADYKIEVREYQTVRNIMSALDHDEGPDLFFLRMYMLTDTYLSEYCEDLTPFLNRDDAFSSEDFVPGLYDGGVHDGLVHWLPYDFTVTTYVVQPAVDVGNEVFSAELARRIADERGQFLFPTMWSREEVLEWVAPYLAVAYTDWDNMTCSFDSHDFAALLEALKAQPDPHENKPDVKQSLLHVAFLNGTFGTLTQYENTEQNGGGDYSITGIPGEAANGSLFVGERCFGMLSSCNNKEAAWRFLSALMSDDAQSATRNLPAVRSALSARMEEAVRDGIITQSTADKLAVLFDTTTCVDTLDRGIELMIVNEAKAFFNGTDSAEETARRIQEKAEYEMSLIKSE